MRACIQVQGELLPGKQGRANRLRFFPSAYLSGGQVLVYIFVNTFVFHSLSVFVVRTSVILYTYLVFINNKKLTLFQTEIVHDS